MTRIRSLVAVIAVAAGLLASCGAQLPPVQVVLAPKDRPAVPAPETPVAPEPVVEPKVEPPPVEAPEPLQDLRIDVLDGAGRPIAGSYCLIPGEKRNADAAGTIAVQVRGSTLVTCGAPHYALAHRDLPPGAHRVHLVVDENNPPPVVSSPSGKLTIDQVLTLLKHVHDAEGINLGAASTRESRNAFLARVVGYVHYGSARYGITADPRWCIKDAGGGRPQSDDVVVLCATREAWDVIPGAGADGYRFEAHALGPLPAEQNVYPPRRP